VLTPSNKGKEKGKKIRQIEYTKPGKKKKRKRPARKRGGRFSPTEKASTNSADMKKRKGEKRSIETA